METTEAARWESAIGRNANRYLRSFERMRARGRWMPGWNSAAFLHSSAWFCYRRMYALALLNFFAPLAVVALGVLAGGLLLPYVVAGYLALVFVLLPMFADALYYRHLESRLARARPPSRWTGLAAAALVAVSAALAVMAMNNRYADQTGRAKIAEVVLSAHGLRAGIDRFFQERGRLPTAEEAGKLDPGVRSRYVESVAFDAARGAVVLRMREPYAGKHIELRPVVQAGQLVQWRCGSPDVPAREMPGSCRD